MSIDNGSIDTLNQFRHVVIEGRPSSGSNDFDQAFSHFRSQIVEERLLKASLVEGDSSDEPRVEPSSTPAILKIVDFS